MPQSQARIDMLDAFGPKALKPGQFVWRNVPDSAGAERVVISLSDQMAYLYRGDTMVAASTISSGKDSKPTPDGIFSIFKKTPMWRSKKYDNAPMPFAQFFDRPESRCTPATTPAFLLRTAASACRAPSPRSSIR